MLLLALFFVSLISNILKSTKLIILIQSLSREELNDWRKYLSASLFNTDRNLLRFHQALSKHYPGFDSLKFTKEKMFSAVFPNAIWNDGKWRNLTSKMTKTLESFLVFLEVNENDFEKRKILVKAIGRRNLYQFFDKEIQLLDKELTPHTLANHSALLDKMLINQLFYYHPQTDKVKNIHHLETAKKYAEEYFKSLQLKLSCDELVHIQIINSKSNRLPTNNQTPYFAKLYEKVYNVLNEGSDMSFKRAKLFIEKNIDIFNNDDKKFGLLHLINFAISKNNLGSYSYKIEMFELYKIGLDQRIFIENGIISEKTFTNIISVSASLGEFQWAKNFIHNYEKYLPKDSKEDAKTLGLANLYFQQNKFSQVIDLLIHFNSNSLTELFIGKTMLLRSYFELFLQNQSFFEMVIAYTYSFEHLVKRKKKLPEERSKGCLNLSKLVRRLSKLIYDKNWNQKTKSDFLKTVINTEPIIGKNWLILRAKEM